MAQLQTIARPYAKAILATTENESQQKSWTDFLNIAAELIDNPEISKRIHLPNFSHDLVKWIEQLLVDRKGKSSLYPEEINFLNLLIDNNRLILLPKISEIYKELLLEKTKVCLVKVQSAQELKDSEVSSLKETLHRKIGQDILLEISVNPDLIAGVLIEYNGQVIDQTMKGRIAAFARLLD